MHRSTAFITCRYIFMYLCLHMLSQATITDLGYTQTCKEGLCSYSDSDRKGIDQQQPVFPEISDGATSVFFYSPAPAKSIPQKSWPPAQSTELSL